MNLPTVDIKGKQYVMVKDRIQFFNENYKDGSITTELLSKPEDQRVVVKATITVPNEKCSLGHAFVCPREKWHRGEMVDGSKAPDCECGFDQECVGIRCFTGHSQAVVGEGMINKTSALENAETSAVGRALAMMGIGVVDSIASADEITKTDLPF